MNKQLGVIVVDYKSMKETCNFIKSFCDNVVDYQNAVFVIVDNSVQDENFKIVWDEFCFVGKCQNYKTKYAECKKIDKFQYKGCIIYALQNMENYGYARANNFGVDFIIKSEKIDVPFFLISNNDILLLEKLRICNLLEAFGRDNKIAVVGPKIIDKNGKIGQSPRKKIPIWKLLILYNISLIFSNRLKKYVDDIVYNADNGMYYWVMGCFLLIDTKKFYEVGMFDNETFLYSEEMILSERLAKKGYSMYYNSDITVFHNHGKTINKAIRSNTNVKMLYYSHRLCCTKYRAANKLLILVSDIVFKIYELQFEIKTLLRKCCRSF